MKVRSLLVFDPSKNLWQTLINEIKEKGLRLAALFSELDENSELCIIQGRLYLASLARQPVPIAKTYFITLKKMRYIPFCADFGPFNLGRLCV